MLIDSAQCDPEAAQAIFANPSLAAKTLLIPLDLTHQVLATKEVLQQLVHGPGSSEMALGPQNIDLTAEARNLRPMLHDLLTFFASTYALVYGLTSGPPLHDPIAVTIVLSEEASKDLNFDDRGERWHVNVVTDGLHSDSSEKRGQVGRIMLRQAAKNEGGVRIPRTLNVKQFWEIIDECIQYAEKALKH